MNSAELVQHTQVEGNEGLPESWERVKLCEVADINMGQSPPGSSYNDQGNGLPFFQGKAQFGDRYPTVKVWCTEPKKIAKPGNVLISVRAPVGPTNVADRECIIGRGLAALTPLGGMPTEYILFALRLMEPQLSKMGTGSTFTAINREILEEIEIDIAPLAEQKRIVAKVEELLARVNAARERLAKVKQIMKRFRQSVLAAACSGRLTADWREDHREAESADHLLERIRTEVLGKQGRKRTGATEQLDSEPYVLPQTWKWGAVHDLCISVTDGDHQAPPKSKKGIPFVVISNISSGSLDLSKTMFVPAEYFGRLPEDRKPKRGDILYSVTGSYGIPVLVACTEKFCFQRHIALLRPHPAISDRYLYLFLLSRIAYEQATAVATGIAQLTVPLSGLRAMRVPVPPAAEQKEIVRRVEGLFNIAKKIEERHEKARSFVDKLTKSILGKAFRGELVPQDPNDEAASTLLKRIRAERVKRQVETERRQARKRNPR